MLLLRTSIDSRKFTEAKCAAKCTTLASSLKLNDVRSMLSRNGSTNVAYKRRPCSHAAQKTADVRALVSRSGPMNISYRRRLSAP